MSQAPSPDPAVLLIGHGTRLAAGVAEFQSLAEQLRQALPERTLAAGFLELTQPSLTAVLEALRRQGVRRITALPAFLMAAGHIKNDIPALINAFQAQYPEMEMALGAELGVDPRLLRIARARIESGEAGFGLAYERAKTLLLMIGHGSSDPTANLKISQITQQLSKDLGFGWALTAYTAVATPWVTEALEQARHLGWQQIVAFPYLLFSGRLLKQIGATVAAYQAAHPSVRVALAPHLNAHPLLIEIFLERLAEAEIGAASLTPNHSLAKS